MDGCGLSRSIGKEVERPGLRRVRHRQGVVIVEPALLPGQTVDDVDLALDRLRVAASARRGRVVPNESITRCEVRLGYDDRLREPFAAVVPPVDAPVQAGCGALRPD